MTRMSRVQAGSLSRRAIRLAAPVHDPIHHYATRRCDDGVVQELAGTLARRCARGLRKTILPRSGELQRV